MDRTRYKRRQFAAWMASGIIAIVITVTWLAGLRMNLTPSLPIGLYRVTMTEGDWRPVRGALVLLCAPEPAARVARDRHYLAHGPCPGDVMPLGKSIAAIPGDTVDVSVHGIAVNGVLRPQSRPRSMDRDRRPLVAMDPGRYPVAPRTIWVIGHTASSWDSRYFGPIADTAIRGLLHPMWTTASR